MWRWYNNREQNDDLITTSIFGGILLVNVNYNEYNVRYLERERHYEMGSMR